MVPKSAIEIAMDISIPENLEIKVMEESANHLILTIPPELSDSASELSEEQLEAVAGRIFLSSAHKILEAWKCSY